MHSRYTVAPAPLPTGVAPLPPALRRPGSGRCVLLLCRLLRGRLLSCCCSNLLLQRLCPIQSILVRPPDHLGVGTLEGQTGLSLQHFCQARQGWSWPPGCLRGSYRGRALACCRTCACCCSHLLLLRQRCHLVVDHALDGIHIHAWCDTLLQEWYRVALALDFLNQVLAASSLDHA